MVEKVSVITDRIQKDQETHTKLALTHLATQSNSLAALKDFWTLEGADCALRSSLDEALQMKGLINSAIAIDTYVQCRRQQPCSADCRCKCHKLSCASSPRLFSRALGSLFIGYSGQPFGFMKCTDRSCRNRSVFSARICYTFPTWFLKKAINLSLRNSASQEICININIRALVSCSTDLFRLTFQDDDHGLQRLFSSGGAHPMDLEMVSHQSALQVC